MGELKPCPFCGGAAKLINTMGIWGPEGYGPKGSRVVCTSPANICCAYSPAFHGPTQDQDAIATWNTRPRTEGRGEGEPVAWQPRRDQDYLDEHPAASEWIYAVYPSQKSAEEHAYGGYEGRPRKIVRPLYASPIREPEISREAARDALAAAYAAGCWAVQENYQPDPDPEFGEAANDYAALNLASPVGGRGEESSSQSQPCADGALPVLTETQQANLAAFAAQVLEALWENYDLDGGDIEDLGQRFGLIRQVPFDPERHIDVHGVGAEAGDDWFVQEPWLTRWSEAAREGTRVAAQVEREGSRDEPSSTSNEEGQTNGS